MCRECVAGFPGARIRLTYWIHIDSAYLQHDV